MNFETVHNRMGKFVNSLSDDESRKLFEYRFKYFLNRDVNALEEKLIKEAPKDNITYSCGFLERYFNRHPENKGKQFVILGAGYAGKMTLRTLNYMGNIEVAGIVDNNSELWGNEVYGHTIEKPDVVKEKYLESVIFIAVTNMLQQINIYYQLLAMGISDTNIFMNMEGSLFCGYGLQYFDLKAMQPDSSGEVFIDAGCYDGMTSWQAKQWAGGDLRKVVAFEADVRNVKHCRKSLDKLGCEYELHNVATWSSKTTLQFELNEHFSYASGVNNGSKNRVEADSIDNVLGGKKATYIKLDVEGSELETLKGAVDTIRRYKPKLAISIYHKPEDIIEIPVFIESLEMDYKYYIRHYQSRWCETVLYAL